MTTAKAQALFETGLRGKNGTNGSGHKPETPEEKAAREEAERLLRNPTRADIATIADLEAAGSKEKWLYPGWLPSGVLTALASEPGLGKTRFCLDLLRRIRTGEPWPDGTPMEVQRDALAMWVVGDNHHAQMVTHSREFGVAEAVYLNALKAQPFDGVSLDSLEDLANFEARVKAVGPSICVIDTVGNTTDLNLSKSEDARVYYAPLQIIARKYECAIICVTHLNAGGKFLGRRVLEKVRVAIQMSQPQPGDERRRLWVAKSYDRKPLPLGMTMRGGGCDYDLNPPDETADAEHATRRPTGQAPPPAPSPRLREVGDWLRGQLSNGARRVSALRTLSDEHGISSKTLYAAKDYLGVEEFESENRKWWRLVGQPGAPIVVANEIPD